MATLSAPQHKPENSYYSDWAEFQEQIDAGNSALPEAEEVDAADAENANSNNVDSEKAKVVPMFGTVPVDEGAARGKR